MVCLVLEFLELGNGVFSFGFFFRIFGNFEFLLGFFLDFLELLDLLEFLELGNGVFSFGTFGIFGIFGTF